MSWYDSIPVVNSIANGNYGTALADAATLGLYSPAKNYFFDEPAEQQKNALNEMSNSANALGGEARKFQMQGLDKAQAFFGPAQQRLTEMYGPPGSMRK